MSPRKTSPATDSQTTQSKAQPSPKREPPIPVPPAIEITLSLGWLLLILGGLSAVAISLIHQEPLLIAIGRAVGWMLLLGLLIYYLADGIMRTLLKLKTSASQQSTANTEATPKNTRDLSV